MGVCGWCDKVLTGPPDKRLRLMSASEVFSGLSTLNSEFVSVAFCCMACAWAYGMREHVVLHCMSPPDAFSHLKSAHGLLPVVGSDDGPLSYESFMRRLAILGRALAKLRGPRSWS